MPTCQVPCVPTHIDARLCNPIPSRLAPLPSARCRCLASSLHTACHNRYPNNLANNAGPPAVTRMTVADLANTHAGPTHNRTPHPYPAALRFPHSSSTRPPQDGAVLDVKVPRPSQCPTPITATPNPLRTAPKRVHRCSDPLPDPAQPYPHPSPKLLITSPLQHPSRRRSSSIKSQGSHAQPFSCPGHPYPVHAYADLCPTRARH